MAITKAIKYYSQPLPVAVKHNINLSLKHYQAAVLAAQMLVDNELDSWHLSIKSVTSYNAKVVYSKQLLILNGRMISLASRQQFVGIVFHEIAHALVGGHHGHGQVFKRRVYELSGSYEYAGYGVRMGVGRYHAVCKACGNKGTVNSDTQKWCRKCYNVLTLTPNVIKEQPW